MLKLKKLWAIFIKAIAPTDYLANPMLRYPPDRPCWCGSRIKAKRCCLPKQFSVIPSDLALRLSKYIKHFEKDKHD